MGAFGSAKASINFLTNNHLPSTEINNVQFNPSYVNSYPHEVDYSQREPSPDYLKGKIMLRTICLIVLLCSSTIMQAHNDNDSLAHRAFWWSENGNPILDGNGQCIRNGSWESLGKPKCLADATDAEPEVAAEVSPTQTTERPQHTWPDAVQYLWASSQRVLLVNWEQAVPMPGTWQNCMFAQQPRGITRGSSS